MASGGEKTGAEHATGKNKAEERVEEQSLDPWAEAPEDDTGAPSWSRLAALEGAADAAAEPRASGGLLGADPKLLQSDEASAAPRQSGEVELVYDEAFAAELGLDSVVSQVPLDPQASPPPPRRMPPLPPIGSRAERLDASLDDALGDIDDAAGDDGWDDDLADPWDEASADVDAAAPSPFEMPFTPPPEGPTIDAPFEEEPESWTPEPRPDARSAAPDEPDEADFGLLSPEPLDDEEADHGGFGGLPDTVVREIPAEALMGRAEAPHPGLEPIEGDDPPPAPMDSDELMPELSLSGEVPAPQTPEPEPEAAPAQAATDAPAWGASESIEVNPTGGFSALAALGQEPIDLDARPRRRRKSRMMRAMPMPSLIPPNPSAEVLASEASIDASIEAAFAPIDNGPLLEEISNGFAHMVASPPPPRPAAPLDDAEVAARIPDFEPASEEAPAAVPEPAIAHRAEEAPLLSRLPELPEETSERDRALIGHLRAEIESETAPERLALLYHSMAQVVRASAGHCAFTVEALRAAYTNDPKLQMNVWILSDALVAQGDLEAAIDLLAEQDSPAARIRAGHLAVELGDQDRAAALWSGDDTGARLARFVGAHRQGDDAAAAALVDAFAQDLDGDAIRAAFRVLRAEADPERMGGLLEIVNADAALAALEMHGVANADHALLDRTWRARIEHLATADVGDERAALARAEAHLKLAWSLNRRGEAADALVQCTAALSLCPGDPYLLQWTIAQARAADDVPVLRQVVEQWTRLATSDNDRAAAHYQLGLLAERDGDTEAARAAFSAALDADPSYAPALSALGRAAIREGRWDDVRQRWDDEVAALERAFAGAADEAEAEAIRSRLARHLFRMARLVEEDLGAPADAMQYDLRALELAPEFAPSFLAVEHAYERAGDWRALLGLYLQRVDACAGLGSKVATLLAAAEIARTRMGDDDNAGRIYARALALDPESVPTLAAASGCFGRLGLQAARIEVEARWGQIDPNAGRRLLRAAELQEMDGDGLAAAAEALPLFRDALTRIPDEPAAIDGLVRAVVRTGRVGELISQIERHDLAAVESPILLISMLEALLSAGYVQHVDELIESWRAVADEDALTVEQRDGLSAIELLVAERMEDWPRVVGLLQAQAMRTAGTPRATRMARTGEIWEHRLTNPERARAAYEEAMAADPDCLAAADGLARLAAVEDEGAVEDGIFDAAWQACADGDSQALAVALVEQAALSKDAEWAEACRAVAGVQTVDDLILAFEQDPARTDRFLAAANGLREAEPVPHDRLYDLLRRRAAFVPAEAADCHFEIALSALNADRTDDAAEAVDALLKADPDHFGARLLAVRLAAQRGEDQAPALCGVAERLASGGPAAALWVAAAEQATAEGADSESVADMHRRAFALDPTQAGAAVALIEHLEASGDHASLRDAYDAVLASELAPDERADFVRRRAELVADALGDPAAALAGLGAQLEAEPSVSLGLFAADLGARVGDDDAVDAGYESALAAAADEARGEIQRRYASILIDRGDDARAVALLGSIIESTPHDRDSLVLLAEAHGRSGQWRQVVELYHRLFELEEDDVSRATRAMAIAEVLSRVKKDHNRAAGWFKRAVELDPGRIRATWRLLAEVDQLDADVVPIEHVNDALDRAAAAVRRRIGREWGEREPLQSLARLHHRRGDKDGRFLACAALDYLGLAGEIEAKIFGHGAPIHAPAVLPVIGDAQRAQMIVHPDELSVAGGLFEVFSLLIAETLADRMPSGCARLSRRSFADWQKGLRALASAVGVDDVELWNAGPGTEFAGYYLPQPALGVPGAALDKPLVGAQRFHAVALLEGLRGGRLLLERRTAEVAECIAVVAQVAAPTLPVEIEQSSVPETVRSRLASRANRLPQRLRNRLAAIAETDQVVTRECFTALATAVRRTRHRMGWLAGGDLAEALDAILFPDASAPPDARGRAEAARASDDARALIEYAVSVDAQAVRAAFNEAE